MEFYPENVLDKLGFEHLRKATLGVTQSVRSAELIAELRPTNRKDRVQVLLAQTSEMMNLLLDPDVFPISELPDIRPHMDTARAYGAIIPLYAFRDILKICVTARITKKYIRNKEERTPTLGEIAEQLIPVKELEHYIKGKVTDSGDLRDDASLELKSIRKRLNSKRNELRSTINKMMRNAVKDGLASDEGATIRNGRMVIPIQAEYKRQIQGFIHDVSSTGQTVYLEPVEALHLNNEIRQYEAEEQQEIERILQELTHHVREHRGYILQNIETLAELDAIASKAKICNQLEAEIPTISHSGFTKLRQAYNPNLKLKNLTLKKEDRPPIVPLDLELTEDEHCLMITGPNAGGKSVAMKTVGICALMMQSGYAIPVHPTTELPVFNGIFVDLGDDQSIENDLSTFSSRLLWMRETQDRLRENSLILIDEAAAGTDPDEGSALFQSFIEYLLNYDCKILVTTHHGALKVFAHEHANAVNGSMEFDQHSLSPTYRFKKGIPGSSYAFEIAERMHLSKSLLIRSRGLLGESKNKMEGLITELEAKAQSAEELRQKNQDILKRAQVNENRYKQKLESLHREGDKIREKALKEAKYIMDNANRKVEKAVEQIIEEKRTNKQQIKNIRADIAKEKTKIETSLEEVKEQSEASFRKSNKPPMLGDFVRFLDGNTTGKLIHRKGNNATVQADGLRLRTKYKNLVKVEPPKPKKQSLRIYNIVSDTSLKEAISQRLDLHGKRMDEALDEMTLYLDKAVYWGLRKVEIIHGKGTGTLKNRIHKCLSDRVDVKSFTLANENEGGTGCTVVYLS